MSNITLRLIEDPLSADRGPPTGAYFHHRHGNPRELLDSESTATQDLGVLSSNHNSQTWR